MCRLAKKKKQALSMHYHLRVSLIVLNSHLSVSNIILFIVLGIIGIPIDVLKVYQHRRIA